MNSLILKLAALLSMIIDHYGAIFHGDIIIYRIIGRLAFPIYCFLLVEGYSHTKDVKKYGIRLLCFALISELPFDFAFFNRINFMHQNIFFTLFIGLITIYLIDNKDEKYNFNKIAVLAAAVVLSGLFFVDYGFVGIIYILSFYLTKELPSVKRFFYIGLVMLLTNLFFTSSLQQFSLLALPVLYFYNNERGPYNKIQQILFYVAYPLHLLIFIVIRFYYIN